MNLDRVVQILKKVNALVENLDDQGQTSAIERDLLKGYLRDLYEHVSDLDSTSMTSVPQTQIRDNHVASAPKAEIEVSEPVKEPEPIENVTPEEESVFSTDGQTTYYDAESPDLPAEAEVPEPVQPEEPTEPEPTKYFPPEPEVKTSQEPVQPSLSMSKAEPEVATMIDESRFAEVFSEKRATDLADKFKLQPIQSIESAMGINQRLQTINELFDGDHNAFVETLRKVNSASGFSEARKALINGPAAEFNWDNDQKVKLASDFVDLVRRKFV